MQKKTRIVKPAAAKKAKQKKSTAVAAVTVSRKQTAPPFDFRTLFEALPGLYLILGPDPPRYTILAVSDAYNTATLTRRDQIVGRGLFEVFPDNPDDVVSHGNDNLGASLGRVLASKRPDVMALQKYDVPNPDGSGFVQKYWEPMNTPVLDQAGEVQYIIHRAEDVTEKILLEQESERRNQANKEAAAALAKSEERFRVMADASPSITWVGSADGGIEFINRRGLEYFGCAVEQLLGEGWLQFVHPDDLQRRNQIRADSLAFGRPVELEYRMRRHDGEYRWQLSRAVPEIGADGKPARWFGVITDIEDLRSAREAAEEATRIKSTFLSSMSHEIRTPMNAIVGMTSILLDTALTPEQEDAASIIRSSGEHLLTVINDILDYSKVEAGKMELESTPFSLRDCIESALDLVSGAAAAKGVEVGYLMQAGTPEGLLGDVGRLRQVLVNLLSNAVKFTPGHVHGARSNARAGAGQGRGQVVIEIAPRSSALDRCEIEIAVRDNGIGIAPDAQKKLFQPFVQADASTTRTHGGTGLGLSISRRIVELMGGSIHVESEPGQGAVFRFTLQVPQAALGQRISLQNAVPALRNRRVLIVDDLEINRRILHHYTQLWGMVPLQTESPKQALDWIERGDPFDLVLLDYHMPEMDGLHLAREIRQRRDERSLPIVMLSSVSLETSISGLISKAMLKPIKPSKLLDAISQVMMERGHRENRDAPAFSIPRTLGRDNPLRILVAEDNAMNQKVARLLLDKLSYQADFVANGEEAVAAVARQLYDVVLMDVQMPVMDGLSATREICRRWSPEQRPRIVGMSANAMQEDRQVATLAGMDDYVPKPVTLEELVRALRQTQRRSEGASAHAEDFTAEGYTQLCKTFEPEGAREIIAALLQDLTVQSGGLSSALDAGDMTTVKRVAHTFKATCQMLGADALSKLCLDLEERAANSTPAQVRADVESMLSRYTALVRRFEQEDASR